MNPLSALSGEMQDLLNSFLPAPIAGNLNAGLTQYIVYLLVGTVILLALIFLFKKKQAKHFAPKGSFVNLVELSVEFVRDSMCRSMLGKTWRTHFPFVASTFFFILIANLVGIIPGAHPGTGTIGSTIALATVSFVYFVYYGMKRHGVLGYIWSLAPHKLFSASPEDPHAAVLEPLEVRLSQMVPTKFLRIFIPLVATIFTFILVNGLVGGIFGYGVGLGDTTVIIALFLSLCFVVLAFLLEAHIEATPSHLSESTSELRARHRPRSVWGVPFSLVATIILLVLLNNVLDIIPEWSLGTDTVSSIVGLVCAIIAVLYVAIDWPRFNAGMRRYMPGVASGFMSIFVGTIEIFSTFLRLITLAIRLFCNMFVGHVVLGAFAILASLFFMPLLQSFTAANLLQSSTSLVWLALLFIVYTVELVVAIVQAYVFTLLSVVYVQLVESEGH